MRDCAARFERMMLEVFLLEKGSYNDVSTPEQIGTWDSFSTVVLVAAMEQYFGVRLTPAQAAALKTVGDIKELLRKNGVDVR